MAFFSIDDIENYPDAAKFFRLAFRLPNYRGSLREEAARQQEKQQHRTRPTETNKRVTDYGEQKALLRNNDAEMAQVKSTKPSYLTERLKQAR